MNPSVNNNDEGQFNAVPVVMFFLLLRSFPLIIIDPSDTYFDISCIYFLHGGIIDILKSHYILVPIFQATNISPTTEANSQVLPSAPPATGSLQTGYHTLDLISDTRDPHMYTGLQPNSNIYQEPMGEGETYEEPDNQPIRGKNAVQSPVYQELPDDVIPNSGPQNKRKNAPNNSSNAADMDRNRGTDYSGDQRPLSDHHYFVLEEHNSQPDSETQTTDTPYHDYFVLEKEET